MAPVPQRADAARPRFREWEVSIVQENHSDGILPESKCIEEVYSGKSGNTRHYGRTDAVRPFLYWACCAQRETPMLSL